MNVLQCILFEMCFLQMNSAPAGIRKWLQQNGCNLSCVREIIEKAAQNGHVAVLEWLHRCMLGGVTAEDCRSGNNAAIRLAAQNGHVGVLEWLHKHIPGGATAEDCRAYDNYALHWAARYGCVPVLEWLATKLTLAEFAKCKCENVWWQMQLQVRRESMLALVVAGKRKKIRLPPELWELVEQRY